MEKILLSKCLLGAKVRYDSKDNLCQHPLIQQWQQEGRLITLCPEMAGGLTTPRDPAAIIGGGGGHAVLKKLARVETIKGHDVTEAYIQGAQKALELIKQHHIKVAILKERSPSCGGREIYASNFTGQKISGEGVTAALLRQHGVKIFNETQIDQVAAYLKRYEK
ncbi:MAG: hypothetical protein K0S08_75 [Gammaproteobacteria bacterium]|jgi:uncharacterized protein YbbK (DUF523 family)|nr:hypothetical protein [Gammaproteobacteria bacterium]